MRIQNKPQKQLTFLYRLFFILLSLVIASGIGAYFFFTHQQKALEQTVQSAQQTAYQQAQKQLEKAVEKSEASTNNTEGPTSSEELVPVASMKQTIDYSGKTVRPLTVEAMKQVDAEKVVTQYGAGTIEIPSIGMKLPILEGMTQENLSVGAGTMKPNQVLGQGNFALAGHYMTNEGLLFGGIKNVHQGDLIQLTYQNQLRLVAYRVTEVKLITKDQGQVISDSQGTGLLTLITCDSSVAGTNGRLMVRAAVVH
jgi:sortase A